MLHASRYCNCINFHSSRVWFTLDMADLVDSNVALGDKSVGSWLLSVSSVDHSNNGDHSIRRMSLRSSACLP